MEFTGLSRFFICKYTPSFVVLWNSDIFPQILYVADNLARREVASMMKTDKLALVIPALT